MYDIYIVRCVCLCLRYIQTSTPCTTSTFWRLYGKQLQTYIILKQRNLLWLKFGRLRMYHCSKKIDTGML